MSGTRDPVRPASAVRIVRVPFLLAWPPNYFAAQVLWPGIIYVRKGVPLSPALIAHELTHIDQIDRMGHATYLARYAAALIRHGYKHHPLELEAINRMYDEQQLARARQVLGYHFAQGHDLRG